MIRDALDWVLDRTMNDKLVYALVGQNWELIKEKITRPEMDELAREALTARVRRVRRERRAAKSRKSTRAPRGTNGVGRARR